MLFVATAICMVEIRGFDDVGIYHARRISSRYGRSQVVLTEAGLISFSSLGVRSVANAFAALQKVYLRDGCAAVVRHYHIPRRISSLTHFTS